MPLSVCLEQPGPKRIRGELSEREPLDRGDVYGTVRGRCSCTCKDSGPIAQELSCTECTSSEEELVVVPAGVGGVEVPGVVLNQHHGAGTLE